MLDLTVDKHKKYIGGKVTVFGEAKKDEIKFHAVNLKISRVLIENFEVEFLQREDLLILNLESLKHKVEFKKLKVEIFYDGKLNENMQGAYLSTYEYNGKTETIVATQFESHYAREAFPCIDEPAAKAVFELAITADKDDLVLTNTPMGEPTPRMSTYLLAFVIGKFHGKTITNAHGTKITTYAALNQDIDSVDFANEVAAKSLEFYDDNFGVLYPLPELLQVALPDFEAGAMENWGLVTYRESRLLVGKNATIETKKDVALTIAHELSHQWFGDLVTMEWWDDLWLNESFASVMEYYAVDAAYPDYNIFEDFFTGDALAALKRDSLSGVQSVHQDVSNPAEIATLFDPAIVYAKGARLMLMVIRMMGWEDFCKGICDYFEAYQYKNTIGDDLWRALNKYAEFDVKRMMHAFIDKPGYPVISEGRQFRFLLDGELKEETWPLAEVREDMSGHYIFNLTEAEFNERLAKFDKLSLEEKLRLLIDRDLVAKTELASSASLLPLIAKFKNENSAAVWNIILTIVAGLKVFFEPGSEEEKKFKKFVLDLVSEKLEEIGIKTRKNDGDNVKRLRSVLLALDFYAEDTKTLKKLALMYDADLEKMDAEIRSDILDAKIYLEPEMLGEYMEAYQKTADPENKFMLLFAGTLMKDKNKLLEMMKYLNRLDVVKPQDQFYLFLYLYRNPRVKAEVFEWMRENWVFVKEISGDKSLENYPRYTASSVRTEEEFEKWKEFFVPMVEDSAVKRAILVGENEIKARLKLIESDKVAVYAALKDAE